MLYATIAVNLFLSVIITSAVYPVIGIIVLVFNVFMVTIGCDSTIGKFFIRTQIKHWGENVNEVVFKTKRLLMSVACLTFALKIGAVLALIIEGGAILLIAFSILIAFGYFFNGAESGMTIGLSYYLARFVVKIFSFISIGFDKIAEWIARAELFILNIEN